LNELTPPQRVFTLLETAAQQAGALVPELEGVAFVVLWDRAVDHPSLHLTGVPAPLGAPDQLGRLAQLTAQLQVLLAGYYAASLRDLKDLEAGLAQLIEEHRHGLEVAQLEASGNPGHGADAADPHGDPQ
jgi:hypothetical protein